MSESDDGVSSFSGFSEDAHRFLVDLGSSDKAWFDEHRSAYQSEIVAPAKAFVEAMGEALASGSYPLIQAQPKVNGSMAPINNDLRFRPDASPYKDHLMFKFWEGAEKKLAATLWIRLHPTDGVGFASGIVLADLDRWRTAVDEHGEPLAAAIARLQAEHHADLAADGLKRVPKPYDPDHPRAELLRAKGFQVRWIQPLPDSIRSAEFVDFCSRELDRVVDVHRWLVEYLG